MPMCDFNKVARALWHRCSPVNLLHIFRTLFPKNTSGGLLLKDKKAIKLFDWGAPSIPKLPRKTSFRRLRVGGFSGLTFLRGSLVQSSFLCNKKKDKKQVIHLHLAPTIWVSMSQRDQLLLSCSRFMLFREETLFQIS